LLGADQPVPGTGAIVFGDQGAILHGSHGAGGCVLLPESKGKWYPTPPEKIPRVRDHFWDWTDAIRNGRPAGSNFDYGGPLTELGLLGAIAVRFPTHKLEWDAAQARFTNLDDANTYLVPVYRDGWTT
jgi:hypothetical protein